MLDRALWEKVKRGFAIIALLAFTLIGYYVGFLCKPYWSFNVIASLVCFFTPSLLMVIYALVTGENALIAIFSKRKAAIATACYLILWLSFGIIIEVYRLSNRAFLTTNDFQSIALSLSNTTVQTFGGDYKLPKYFLTIKEYPRAIFYISRGVLNKETVEAINEEIRQGSTVSIDVTKTDFDTKLTKNKQMGILNCLYCPQIVEIHSFTRGSNHILPLTDESVNRANTFVWALDGLNIAVFILLPIFFLYRLRRNWSINKERGFTDS